MSASAITAGGGVRTKTIPIIEIFGPTIQGEGAEAGVPTHFVRVGGCDYRCSWCDTMYAVDPVAVRENAEHLNSEEIVQRVIALDGKPGWVTVSGGNPALHELGELVAALHDSSFHVSVETQGSRWLDWLGEVERLTISPKAPSSGMATPQHAAQFEAFMSAAMKVNRERAVVKIAIFNEHDLAWAQELAARWPDLPLFLSAGTPVPSGPDIRDAVGERYRWLCEIVSREPRLAHARVLPQLHVIAWKAATGV